MRILIVDNEELAVRALCNTIKKVVNNADITSVTDSEKAKKIAKELNPDIAFLDIDMPVVDGLTLAKFIKEKVNPRTNIIFTTGYDEYIQEAFTRLRASGYLMKPITPEMVKEELDDLRHPIVKDKWGSKRVRVRAFGNFEVFVDDTPVVFHYNKTKELFAYLIDSGGMCTTAELQEKLWDETMESTDHRSYLQNMISDLTKVMGELDCKDVVIRKYGSVGIDSARIDCDYYEYMQGNPAAINTFTGEYMSQYSWAENTLGKLVFLKDKD